MRQPLRSFVVLFAALFLASLPGLVSAQNPGVTVSVNGQASRKPIDPRIYGLAHASTATLNDLNVPLNRNGGNNTSRYNWQQNADNRGSDWYFESIPDASAVAGERGDTFVTSSKNAAAQAMLTIPMTGWVAKVGANRSKLASYSIAKYGAQTGSDAQWFPDAGNGVRQSDGANITWNDKNDASVPADSLFMQGWVNHLIATFGSSASGGLKYYVMDNEPGLWHGTHRDVWPTGVTMDQYRDRLLDYAAKVKDRDSGAIICAPEEWGWTGYFYSGYDAQYGGQHGWGFLPDRSNHGGMDFMPWLLDQLRQNNTSSGRRLLDVFTLHIYPQGGEFSNDTSSAMQLRRNRSTRALWDPNYVDETWINSVVRLIPRMREWVNTYYPGTQIGITEYNWGAEGHINGATTQADILGIFGREGLDLAARWTVPDAAGPAYKAYKMYRNYDGNKSTFGNTSVSCTVPNPDNLSAFAAQRSSDGAATVMVISKVLSGSTSVTLNVSNFTNTGVAQRWQLTSTNTITRLADITFSGSSVTTSVPAQSITLFVLPQGSAAAPTFTSSAGGSPSTVAPGAVSVITVNATCTGGALSNGIVDLEIYNSAGTRVSQQYWTAQSFTSGQSRSYTYNWTAPATTGAYTLRTGVFGANWTPNYNWNASAGTVTVAAGDAAQYNFEAGTQGWTSSGGMISGVARSSIQKFAGTYSLQASFTGTTGQSQRVSVANPSVPAGRTVTFHVWVPAGSKLTSVQPYVQEGASGNWRWTGNWQPIGNLTAGAWTTLTVAVAANATPLSSLGVEFTTNAGWTGSCYVDTVSW